MAIVPQATPGVLIQEQDFTNTVPSPSVFVGALVGDFEWGPCNQITLVSSEQDLFNQFKGPVNRNAGDWFVAKNFLAYSNALQIIRAVDSTSVASNAINLTGVLTNSVTAAVVPKVIVLNYSDFQSQRTALSEIVNAALAKLDFIAAYPGILGNSLSVSYADSAAFASWAYASYFNVAPLATANEACLVVLLNGVVVEKFKFSLIAGSVDYNNQPYFMDQVINGNSAYIYALNENLIQYTNPTTPLPFSNGSTPTVLAGGNDTTNTTALDSQKINGWNMFAAATNVAMSYALQGGDNSVPVIDALQQCVTTRKDCVGFVSPPASAVVNQLTPTSGIINYFLTTLNAFSSYLVADGNYKYQYDYYNSVYRWVPLNGDIAGLCAQIAQNQNPYTSPGGQNIQNVVKLAYNPSSAQQGELYSIGVNPVISQPGQGYVLWGDKTLLNSESAFSRINVRFLFIELETMIKAAAQALLFKFNNTSTQTQFNQLVTPFLRSVQGAGGIERVNGKDGFIVVSDSSINTPQVVDSNQFKALIAVKPSRSINWITLTFAAVNTDVNFQEFIGLYANTN